MPELQPVQAKPGRRACAAVLASPAFSPRPAWAWTAVTVLTHWRSAAAREDGVAAVPGSGVMMLTGGVEAAEGNSALVGLPVGTPGISAATGPARRRRIPGRRITRDQAVIDPLHPCWRRSDGYRSVTGKQRNPTACNGHAPPAHRPSAHIDRAQPRDAMRLQLRRHAGVGSSDVAKRGQPADLRGRVGHSRRRGFSRTEQSFLACRPERCLRPGRRRTTMPVAQPSSSATMRAHGHRLVARSKPAAGGGDSDADGQQRDHRQRSHWPPTSRRVTP